MRLDGCCVELHYGIVSEELSLFSWAITRLRGNWVRIRPQNFPKVQLDTTLTQFPAQLQKGQLEKRVIFDWSVTK